MRPSVDLPSADPAGFDLDAAAGVTGYLRDLGVGWAYLSPLLQADRGSDHGYDVVDPSRVDPARGGADGLERFAAAARRAGLGILVDIVPNHMGIARARARTRGGGTSSLHGRSIAVRGGVRHRLGLRRRAACGCRSSARSSRTRSQRASSWSIPVRRPDAVRELRYYDHVLPLAPGTAPEDETTDAAALRGVLDGSTGSCCSGGARPPTSTTVASSRRRLSPACGSRCRGSSTRPTPRSSRWVREGLVDGLRVDHPDGLLDPGGYLERLSAAHRRRVRRRGEDPGARRPPLRPAGVVGDRRHDRLRRAGRDRPGAHRPGGRGRPRRPRCAAARETTAADAVPCGRPHPRHQARPSPTRSRCAEVRRLVRDAAATRSTRARGRPRRAPRRASRCTAPTSPRAGSISTGRGGGIRSPPRPRRGDRRTCVPLLADPAHRVARRFQQTTGPVMAKGVEDTAFYRYTRLGTLTEVGGDPSHVLAAGRRIPCRAQARRQATGRTR